MQNEYIVKTSKITEKYIDWNQEVIKVVEAIKKNQTPNVLKECRVYNLLVGQISAGLIIREFLKHLMPILKEKYKPYLIHWAAVYECMEHSATQELPFIEAFLARVMVLL